MKKKMNEFEEIEDIDELLEKTAIKISSVDLTDLYDFQILVL
jgi:hypothetical protein